MNAHLPANTSKNHQEKRKPLPNPKFLLELKKFGYQRIVGIDEVGRGAGAGPLVVGAVEINFAIPEINDSKLIGISQRQKLSDQIKLRSKQISFGQVSNDEIDQLGLVAAQRLAYQRCLDNMVFDLILTDNYELELIRHIKAVKGDQLFYPVAAASIVAKVYRDQLMQIYHRAHPEYDWQNNAGYLTKKHMDAISKYGQTPLHRRTFLH